LPLPMKDTTLPYGAAQTTPPPSLGAGGGQLPQLKPMRTYYGG